MTYLETIASAGHLGAVTRFLREASSPAGFAGEMLSRLELVAEELFLNIAIHACPEETVRLGCAAMPGQVVLEFDYGGEYFDPRSAPEPQLDAPLSERRRGGLGIFLVRKFADSIDYRRRGSRNLLRVRLASRDTAPASALQSSL